MSRVPAYKQPNGSYLVRFYITDIFGNKKQVKKRGFKTKREALAYESDITLKKDGNLNICHLLKA